MLKLPRYSLAQLLDRKANNLDLIRLGCAGAVIFGHVAVVLASPRYPFGDPFSRWLNYDGIYSAAIAVQVFFFISGLLVTDSLLRKKSPAAFLIGRIMRVWPALLLLLLGTVFVVGPVISSLTWGEYFTHRGTYRYFWENLLLGADQYLPGVFANNPHPNRINASLWTLTYEIECYAVLLVLFALKLTRQPWLCFGVVLFLCLEPLLSSSVLFPMQANALLRYLPSAFALGAFMAIVKDRITLSLETVLILGGLFLTLKSTFVGQHFFFFFIFAGLLYASALPWMRRIRLPADLSYGTYLWGFLVQQIIASQFAERGFGFNFFSALLISLFLAFLSWHLVEKHAIAAGHRWAKKFV